MRWKALLLAVLVAGAPVLALAQASPAVKVTTRIISVIISHPSALPDQDILRFAETAAKTGGSKQVSRELGKRNLPKEVLEDAYLRIAVQREAVTRKEAEELARLLRGTPGFRGALSKTIGVSPEKTAGHLNEIRIAKFAAEEGIAVKEIGQKFTDLNKRADTDIDVLLKLNGTLIPVEAKAYEATSLIPMDKFRDDFRTLDEFRKENMSGGRVMPVFSITQEPSDPKVVARLSKAAKDFDVELIYGAPEEQVIQIRHLEKLHNP